MLDDDAFILAMTAYYSDQDPLATPATKAAKFCAIMKSYIKTASIKVGSLKSVGEGNMGLPVDSENLSGGEVE